MLEHRQVIIGAHYDTAIDQMFAESQVVPKLKRKPQLQRLRRQLIRMPQKSRCKNDEILPDWQSYNGFMTMRPRSVPC